MLRASSDGATVQIIGTAIGRFAFAPVLRASGSSRDDEGKRLGKCDVCHRIVESKARRFVRKYCSNVRTTRDAENVDSGSPNPRRGRSMREALFSHANALHVIVYHR
jgi:hypothetical protein